MIYFNIFLVFSILGFILESVVFKFHNVNNHSSILFGPYTFVYGAGGIAIYLLSKLFINTNLWIGIEIIIIYSLLTILLTTIEFLDGNLIKLIFKTDMWDYSGHRFHFKKYICLDLALIWGLLGTIFYYHCFDFINQIINLISIKGSICCLIILLIDIIITLFKKRKKKLIK